MVGGAIGAQAIAILQSLLDRRRRHHQQGMSIQFRQHCHALAFHQPQVHQGQQLLAGLAPRRLVMAPIQVGFEGVAGVEGGVGVAPQGGAEPPPATAALMQQQGHQHEQR